MMMIEMMTMMMMMVVTKICNVMIRDIMMLINICDLFDVFDVSFTNILQTAGFKSSKICHVVHSQFFLKHLRLSYLKHKKNMKTFEVFLSQTLKI